MLKPDNQYDGSTGNSKMVGRLRRSIHKHTPFLFPLVVTIFPPLFHYGNNAAILLFSSLLRLLLFNFLLSIVIYIIFYNFYKHNSIRAANGTVVFLIFYNTYGIVYRYLLRLDLFQIEHYTLLPFYLLLAVDSAWLISRIKEGSARFLWNIGVWVFGLLLIFNAFKIIPAEFTKARSALPNQSVRVDTTTTNTERYPDIYYIVLDEFSGFEPMREYWQYKDIDKFSQFLKSKGFSVIENSHSHTINTLYELATRLNYQAYPCCENYPEYFAAISKNKVTEYLKAKGYTFVAFEELRAAFPADTPFLADYLYESDPNSQVVKARLFDEFGVLVFDNTMVSAFSNYYKNQIADPFLKQHNDFIDFTVEKISNLGEVPTPKFVYVHLLLPHVPFMFDQNGNVIGQQYRNNWNYYLGNYIYSLEVLRKMVNNLMSQVNSERPPVIILQSDHGARNQLIADNKDTLLQNFPEDFKTSIMFVLYIPGYDYSSIPQDVDPINTFPIVFNYLFDANISLR